MVSLVGVYLANDDVAQAEKADASMLSIRHREKSREMCFERLIHSQIVTRSMFGCSLR